MDSSSFYQKPETTGQFRDFYKRLETKNAAPLWENLADIVPVQPRPQAVPALWRYEEMRPLLMESGKLITAKEADRRGLIFSDPWIKGKNHITNTLYSGPPLILSREGGPTPRPKAASPRLVMAGGG